MVQNKLSSCMDAADGQTAASLGILLELPRECNSVGQPFRATIQQKKWEVLEEHLPE
jgi:hypothetical protein